MTTTKTTRKSGERFRMTVGRFMVVGLVSDPQAPRSAVPTCWRVLDGETVLAERATFDAASDFAMGR